MSEIATVCGKHLKIPGVGGPDIGGRSRWMMQGRPAEKVAATPITVTHIPNPATYSCRIATDIPLLESPRASFDKYLGDRSRVFRAMFPDSRRSRRLDEEQWRIQMLPINFLFLTVWPVVDMKLKCQTNGENYPAEVPCDVTKVLRLEILRWRLRGLDSVLQPSHFGLGVRGALYADRRGSHSRLKGLLEMKMSMVLPPVLAAIPEDVRRSVAESVLKALAEKMKDSVNGSLQADYSKFKREKQRSLA